MSNSRKLRQANGGSLTRPHDQWGPGKVRTGERQGAGTASALWRRAQRAWAAGTERGHGAPPGGTELPRRAGTG